ncbi:MAG: zinc ribbon domain-containing protein [Candidatus Methanoplasma sp.]|jgi:predicted DNA repair protein MutK|nr:zinc ribbon domain-containing protein [Candidatus Methanoplasma sp.]
MYCSKCGKEVTDGSAFCPSCGGPVADAGTAPLNQNYNQNYNQSYQAPTGGGLSSDLGGTLTIIMVLGFIWGILALLTGVFFASTSTYFLFAGGIVIGGIAILSGLLALISAYFIYKRENFQLAFIACIIGSILALPIGIIAGIIGLVFAFLLNNEKGRFHS